MHVLNHAVYKVADFSQKLYYILDIMCCYLKTRRYWNFVSDEFKNLLSSDGSICCSRSPQAVTKRGPIGAIYTKKWFSLFIKVEAS